MERQLDGTITKMVGQVAPSGDEIYELFSNRDKPVLILMDEIFNYIKRAIAVTIGKSDLADQTITFMQNFNGQLGSLPNVCLFMYSFPSKMDRGATLEEVKRASFTDQTSHWVAGDAAGKLKRRCFYLEETDDGMLYFDINPNINHIIDHAKRNVTDALIHDAERNLLDGAKDGGRFVNIHILPDEIEVYNIPDRPVLQLVICKKNNPEWCKSCKRHEQTPSYTHE